MKFKIKGDKEQIKKFLDVFIEEAKKEYDLQKQKFKMFPMPEMDFAYWDDGDDVVFSNTVKTPKFMKFLGRGVKKMEDNLRKFLESYGLKVEVKWIGD